MYTVKDIDTGKLIDVQEAAEIVDCHERTLYKYLNTEMLTTHKVTGAGNRYYLVKVDVERFARWFNSESRFTKTPKTPVTPTGGKITEEMIEKVRLKMKKEGKLTATDIQENKNKQNY